MNINEVKADIPNIDKLPTVVHNLDLLSNYDAASYLSVDPETQKLQACSWLWSSRLLDILKAVEATFSAAIQKEDDQDIMSLYRKSFRNLSVFSERFSLRSEEQKILNMIKETYSLKRRFANESPNPAMRAKTVTVGGGASRSDRLANEWVLTRWQMRRFMKELKELKLDPEYKSICQEVKQCLPKAPPATQEQFQSLLSQLNEQKSRLKKFERDPIEPPKKSKTVIGKAVFCPTQDELNEKINSLNKTQTEKSPMPPDPFAESIASNQKTLKKTGALQKLLEVDERKINTVIASNPKTGSARAVSAPLPAPREEDELFELSPFQQKVYEIKESFDALGPKEKLMQLLESTMYKVGQMHEQLQCSDESSEDAEGSWSSEEHSCIEITMEELEGLTDSEESEDSLEEHTIDPEHRETFGQLVNELKSYRPKA